MVTGIQVFKAARGSFQVKSTQLLTPMFQFFVIFCNFVALIELHRGGGKKQSGRHHPPTLKSSLRASQICNYFLQGGLGKKVIRCQSLGGGVYALNEFFEKIQIFFFCNIADNIIQFVVSIGFLCVRRYGLSQLSAQ